MSEKRWVVTLDEAERTHLHDLITTGTRRARTVVRAQVLLKAADGESDPEIAAALPVCARTVARLRKRCVADGVEAALANRKSARQPAPLLDGAGEARLVTLACSPPPDGRARWTLRLLAATLVEQAVVPHCSHEAVRQALKKTNSSRGRTSSGVSRRAPMRHTSRLWKMSLTSTSSATTRGGR